MTMNLILPMSLALSTVSFALIARWYIAPRLVNAPLSEALTPLLLLHTFRHIGMAFLIPGVTAAALDARFSQPAAYGDLLAAALAFAAIAAVRGGWKAAVPIVWVFNIEGTLDLLYAVGRGIAHTPDGHLGATYFIPAIIVPALLVSHAMVFWLLWTHGSPPIRAAGIQPLAA